ncbi:MAG: protein kinase [Anaerolineales bacterium]|nr:protein kinase [Anaerolineales bacterium]
MSAWSGKTVGKVKVGDLIARGGMAEVYSGEHTTLNRKVAVKIMRDFVDPDPEAHSRFEREARVIANLRHPNIIQLFDYELVSGQPCLVMELVPGVSLGGYLRAAQKRGDNLPFDTISQILTSLASAIDYAHSQNIVHRDIKPANILLRSKNGIVKINEPLPQDVEPVLTDFGLVRLLDSTTQTSTGTVSGTPAYMSPEQARGDKVDKKTDIYSLGVVLYEMLAGRVPFDSESSFGILMKHLNEPPPPIPNISSDLQTVIDRALAKDSAHRYNSAKELVDEFIAVFNGQTVSLNTISQTKMAKAFAKPKTSQFSTALAGVSILAIIVLAFLAFRPTASSNVNDVKPIGKASFLDFNAIMDKTTLTFTDLPALEAGTHYDVWAVAQGGETRRNIGTIKMDNDKQGQLVYISAGQANFLGLFDQLEVTIEPSNDPNPNESSGDVVASSVFPPLSLIHVRHVLVSYGGAPQGNALIQGLYWTADEIDNSVIALEEAFRNNDEEAVRKNLEEVINQLVGNSNTELYLDWNEDGTIDDPSDGFGLIENEDEENSGYIPTARSHAFFAADAPDATESIKIHSQHTIIAIDNMEGWAEQLLDLALELQEMPFGAEMEAIILEMRVLSDQILLGVDSNGNELIEPILGEGGADTAYEHAYYMAEMPMLLGANRIPLPAVTESP